MLRKFKVNVNGKEYLVELEELGEPGLAQVSIVEAAPVAVVPVPTPQSTPIATVPVAQQPVASGAGVTLEAPMPGNILEIKVNVGDTVKFEQPLVILEAMKMENELVAPKSGTITAIHVTANSPIDVGQPIITIG